MNNIQELTQMWAKQTELYESNIALNTSAIRELKLFKAEQSMRGFLRLNIFSLVVSLLTAIFSGYFMYTHIEAIHMLISGLVMLVWSLLIFIGAINQIQMQVNLDYAKPVIEVQNQLNKVALSALYYLRASLMILPFYFAFLLILFDVMLGIDLFIQGDKYWLISQALFSLLLGALAVFLFIQLSPNNINKPLTQWLMKGCGSQALQAAHDLKQLQDYQSRTHDEHENTSAGE